MSKGSTLETPGVSIVLIGHNEGKTLERSFRAIENLNYPKDKIQIIFVDSNSTDDSLDTAKNYADNIISIKSKWPTAGEAFNVGILHAHYDYVHITAGDIFLNPDYLQAAILRLQNDKEINVVTGCFEEENKKGWNKLLGFRRDDDNNQEEHYVDTPNGGTFRKSVFIELSGYDERVKKGQETEIGYRLRQKRYRILQLNIQQGFHDFGLKGFKDMAGKYFGHGISLGHLFVTSLINRNENAVVKGFAKSAFNQIVIAFFGFFLIVLSLTLNSFTPIIIIIIFFFYFVIPILKVLIKYRKKSKNYKIHLVTTSFFRLFILGGVISFILRSLLNIFKGISVIDKRHGLELSKSKLRTIKIVKP